MLGGITSRLDNVEDWISNLEDRIVKSPNENSRNKQKKKKIKGE